MGRMFGKDGLRGLAVTELTCELAMQIGRAVASVLAAPKDEKTTILIGKDQRSSSDALEAAVCAGICSAGADVELLGAVPTPALSWQLRDRVTNGERPAQGGIMITASYVNSEFNGIKLFSNIGDRLSEDLEDDIEYLVKDMPSEIKPIPRRIYGRTKFTGNIIDDYIEHIKEIAPADLSGMKIAVDCANGSASLTARRIFTELGAEVLMMGDKPDGANINICGSTHIDELMELVVNEKCCCGIAFDGSGERCLAVDENGCLVDGDVIIAACARAMKEQGRLRHNTIMVSQANNLGLLQFARNNGIGTSTASTGERAMIRRMLTCGYSLGGDPMGQILFPDDAVSSDGQLTGIRLLEVLKSSGGKMSELSAIIEKWPQVMLNVPITRRFSEVWKNDRAVIGVIDEFEEILGEEGRVVVREIGREPVIRIRIEGQNFSTINAMALQIADTIRERMELRD